MNVLAVVTLLVDSFSIDGYICVYSSVFIKTCKVNLASHVSYPFCVDFCDAVPDGQRSGA